MAKIDHGDIVTKAVEISKSLVNTQTGMHTYDLEVTRGIGDLARFAITIKGVRSISGEEQIAAISNAMKIDYRIVKSEILGSMEKLGWLEIDKEGSKVSGIREKVPPTEDIIKALGEEWFNRTPGTIDEASVKALTVLCNKPYESEAMESELIEVKINES